MVCVSPGEVNAVVINGVSTARVTLRHCDDAQYLFLAVEFAPRNIGAAVDVQGTIWIDGQSNRKEATGIVRFHDDGTITNYGDTSNGVRFRQRRFDYDRPHTAGIRAVAVR